MPITTSFSHTLQVSQLHFDFSTQAATVTFTRSLNGVNVGDVVQIFAGQDFVTLLTANAAPVTARAVDLTTAVYALALSKGQPFTDPEVGKVTVTGTATPDPAPVLGVLVAA